MVVTLALPDPPLSSLRVALRPMADADVAWLATASRDPLIPRFTRVPADNSEADVRAFLLAQDGLLSAGRELHLLVVDRRRGQPAGAIGLHHVDAAQRSGHIGYWTAAASRGDGLTSEAVRLLSAWALDVAGLERIELRADVENLASQRVAERSGYRREGVLRDVEWRPSGRRSQVLYSLLAGELTSR